MFIDMGIKKRSFKGGFKTAIKAMIRLEIRITAKQRHVFNELPYTLDGDA